MRSAVICLAAGQSQLPVIRKARQRGFAVVAVDRDREAPGFKLCDVPLHASTYEAGPILEALQPLQDRYRFMGVLNRSAGPPVITAAEIAQQLGLPGAPPDSARTVVEKHRLLAFCASHGINAPRGQSARRREELRTHELRYPCVVKPSLSLVGKSGVRVVHSRAELGAAFEQARRVSLNGWVNVEAWVPGHDVGLVSVVRGGKLYPITLIDERNVAASSGSIWPRGVRVPSTFSGRVEEERIHDLARQLISYLEIDTSAFMLACRCEPGGRPHLTEVHLDLGADRILDELLPAATPFDTLGYLVDMLSGAPPLTVDWQFEKSEVLFGRTTPAPFAPAPTPGPEA